MSVLYNYVIADPNVEEELGPPPLPPKQPKDNKPAEDKPPPRPPHDVKKSAQPYSLTKLGSTSINSLPTPKPLPRPQSASSLLYNVNSPNVSFNGSGSNIEIAVRSIKYDTGGETSTSFFKVDNNDKLLTSSKVRLKPSSSTGSLLKTNETAVTLREQLNRDKNQIPTLGSSTELFSG
ncbi:hypothetical protein SARC_15785 [Sphaeroforma arctica JP610]|uniref:Uncharacterized protein n=1 Tax=Sphaeroforma arctica JP610 TaxID=667725 RepID=A0A0L0F519_9EUKA|nr:hypothetical protein SARC_15785 [Sphaeroforma arctica JP610]KNC71676.1 hypothetical protein SARC_15785 [Sphaeroforma arctica JP610]|eukprot:XP_014145578.1 hypothetical protein SARC_15785 [Sphaeroforma arctica JP610]